MIGKETFLTIERAKNGFIILGQDDAHNRYRTDVARSEQECTEIVRERIKVLPVPEELKKKDILRDAWEEED